MNLLDSIPAASDVRRELEQNPDYVARIKQNIQRLNDLIQEAKKEGQNHTCFVADSIVEHEIRNLYIQKGYHFKPTGKLAGVWQESEEICW